MTARKAPRNYVGWIAAGLPALMLAGSAGAANEMQPLSPELVAHTEPPLRTIIDKDPSAPALQALDAADVEEKMADGADEATLRNTEIPDIATRLTRESARDMPRFRREMFRTDI